MHLLSRLQPWNLTPAIPLIRKGILLLQVQSYSPHLPSSSRHARKGAPTLVLVGEPKDSALANSIPLCRPTCYSIFCIVQFLSSPAPTVAVPFPRFLCRFPLFVPLGIPRMQQGLFDPTNFVNPVISGLMGRYSSE